MFGDNGKGECFKPCDACRVAGRASKARVKLEQDEDKWALMTRESLDLLSYEEREAIPTNLDTVVSNLNIFFFGVNVDNYCEGVEYTSIMDTEKIRVWMTRREGYFGVKFGDTWAEVRENIHCC